MDETKTTQEEEQVKSYDDLIKIGIGTIAAVVALLSGTERVKAMLVTFSGGQSTLRGALPLVLFIQSLLLVGAWYTASKHELAILSKYYKNYAPMRSFSTLPVTIIVSVVLVLLAYYSDKILVYSIIYAVYLGVAVAGRVLVEQHIIKAYLEAENDISIPAHFKDEVFRFYVKRPYGLLNYFSSALTFLAIICASLARLNPVQVDRVRFENYAYGAMISSLLIGEIIIWSWRARLYSKTREI